MRIGVLALQGDVREHVTLLQQLGVETQLVRNALDLELINGLILPGGESTSQFKLLKIFGLFDPLQRAIRKGLPVLGTCAGLIHLSTNSTGLIGGQETLGVLDVSVNRNAYGSQLNSFEAEIKFRDHSPTVAFIRAPKIEAVGAEVEVLATHDSVPVIVKQGRVFGATCHPEITGDTSLHEEFLAVCREALV